MFSTSTQRKFWMFSSEEEVADARRRVHEKYVDNHGGELGTSQRLEYFLTLDEANEALRFYEEKLLEFCVKFKPPMPKATQGTASQYFKRFYLNNSVMDFHPKEILVTSAYLACKVEEFNVSIDQFIANIKGDKERAMDVVLNNEMLLMRELNFHLTVHNPFRPVEGLLIDVKTRCKSLQTNAEVFRKEIERFLDKLLLTNSLLIYAPSQVALAAIIHGAGCNNENVDSYVTDILFNGDINDKLKNIVDTVRKIRLAVKNLKPLDTSRIKAINEKLERCRNQENNPDSQSYKRKLQEELEDEDERSSKMPRLDESGDLGLAQPL